MVSPCFSSASAGPAVSTASFAPPASIFGASILAEQSVLPSREDDELLTSVAASSCPPVTVAVDSIKPAMRERRSASSGRHRWMARIKGEK